MVVPETETVRDNPRIYSLQSPFLLFSRRRVPRPFRQSVLKEGTPRSLVLNPFRSLSGDTRSVRRQGLGTPTVLKTERFLPSGPSRPRPPPRPLHPRPPDTWLLLHPGSPSVEGGGLKMSVSTTLHIDPFHFHPPVGDFVSVLQLEIGSLKGELW